MGYGCQPRVNPVAPHSLRDSITADYLLKRLEYRAGKIANFKSFARTTFLNQNQKQIFRQALAIQNNQSIRVDTYGLFGQVVGIFIYHNGKAVFFNPVNGKYYSGAEMKSLVAKMLGTQLDFREHLRVFVGDVPRLDALKVLDSHLNADRTRYILRCADIRRGGNVTIQFSAATLLPLRMTRKLAGRSVYSVTWREYAKVGDYDFPHLTTLSFPEKRETIRVKYENPAINQKLPSDTFQFMVPVSSSKNQ